MTAARTGAEDVYHFSALSLRGEKRRASSCQIKKQRCQDVSTSTDISLSQLGSYLQEVSNKGLNMIVFRKCYSELCNADPLEVGRGKT